MGERERGGMQRGWKILSDTCSPSSSVKKDGESRGWKGSIADYSQWVISKVGLFGG